MFNKKDNIKFNFASEEEFLEATKDFDKLNEQLKFSTLIVHAAGK